jgi:hypothetical protein
VIEDSRPSPQALSVRPKMSTQKVFRWTVALILLVPIAYLAGVAGLNYSGYCFDQSRYLSDTERVRAGIDAVLSHYQAIRFVPEEMPSVGKPAPSNQKNFRASDAKGTEITQDQLVLYRDAEEFKAINPDCCNFGRQDLYGEVGDTEFWWKITGFSAGFFNARYQIRYRDSTGQVHSRWTGSTFHYANCGHSNQGY